MSLLFSRRCEYALQAVLFAALKKGNSLTTIKELTDALGIPYHFLAKILQDLSRKGLLISHKGPRGGFGLGLPPRDITLFHIIEAIDGVDFTRDCVLGFPECSETTPCALHATWSGLREEVYRMLVNRSIEQLAREMRKSPFPGRALSLKTP